MGDALWVQGVFEIRQQSSRCSRTMPRPLRLHMAPGFHQFARVLRRSKMGRKISRLVLGLEHHPWGSITKVSPIAAAMNAVRRRTAKLLRIVSHRAGSVARLVDAPIPAAERVEWRHVQYAAMDRVKKYAMYGNGQTTTNSLPIWAVAASQRIFEMLGPYDLLAMRAVDKGSKQLVEQPGPWRAQCLRALPGIDGFPLSDAEAAIVEKLQDPDHVFSWMKFYWQAWRLNSVDTSEVDFLRELPAWLAHRPHEAPEHWLCVEVLICTPGDSLMDKTCARPLKKLIGRVFLTEKELTGFQGGERGTTRGLGLVRASQFRLPLPSAIYDGRCETYLRVFAHTHGRLVPVVRLTKWEMSTDRWARGRSLVGAWSTAQGELGGITGGKGIAINFQLVAPLYQCVNCKHSPGRTPLELKDMMITLKEPIYRYLQSQHFEAVRDASEYLAPYKSLPSQAVLSPCGFFRMLASVDQCFECAVCLDQASGACGWTCIRCKKSIHLSCWRKVREVKAECPYCRESYMTNKEEDNWEEEDDDEDDEEYDSEGDSDRVHRGMPPPYGFFSSDYSSDWEDDDEEEEAVSGWEDEDEEDEADEEDTSGEVAIR